MPTLPNEKVRGELCRALLAPRSVAIVGQSNDPDKVAGRPLRYLRQAGYSGRIYPVNANRDTVLGERAWASLASIPEIPEHAYIVTPTEAAIGAVEECGRLGVKIATVLADGFTESGDVGLERVARLRDISTRTGVRIVGPSSLGVVNLRAGVMLTANAAFDDAALPAGRIFAASHSGSMIGALVSRGKPRGVGFAALVSVGNEVDLSLGEICSASLDDPEIDGYVLFLESLRGADELRSFALAAADRDKPILAYMLGRSSQARELALSHTGALAGDDKIADAFLAECGIARVDTLEGLIEGFPLLKRVSVRQNIAARRAVAVVTTTAGGATMVVDPLATRGIRVDPPSGETLARLAAAGVSVRPARIIDLTIAGTRYETMRSALEIVATAPEFDLILAVVGSSARFHPDLAVKPIIDCAAAAKPIAAYLVPDAPQALAALSTAGVPSFRTPESCADAIAATLRRRCPRTVMTRRPLHANDRAPALVAEAGLQLDEIGAYALLGRIGIGCAPAIELPVGLARAPALPFSYPVAVKALTAKIGHKTEIGGVELEVPDGDGLLAAIRRIRSTVAERQPDVDLDRVLVQPMVRGLGEILLGYRTDRDVGPLVMVAAGGVLAEIYQDQSLRLAPVDLATAREMLADVRGLAALAGYRGKPKGDLAAVADAVVALSRLALMDEPAVLEVEINPLMVRPAGLGVVAVDALARLKPSC